jgi:hypothetical protein
LAYQLIKQAPQQRENLTAAVAPAFQFGETSPLKIPLCIRWQGVTKLRDLGEPFFALGEAWLEFLPHKASSEAFNFNFGGEMIAPVSRLVDGFNRPKGP